MTLNEKIQRLISDAAKLRVAVIGETIVDEFVNVSYEGQSMKSMCPVFKLEGGVTSQMGGAAAIAGHLKGFVESVELISNGSREIVKTRYVDVNNAKKHVEINQFDKQNFPELEINSADYDVVIVADFGHGFCDRLTITDNFHLMCQTNSNNFGFNRVSKWKSHTKKSVCLDLREASLQMNKKFAGCTDEELLEMYRYEMGAQHLFLTVGKAGSLYTNGTQVFRQPSFKSEIVDTIGAGDTFYAFACLSAELGRSPGELLEIPALAASLSTTWLCNENSVTPENLLEYADRFISEKVQ